jgi:single-strand DNA-binding protein
MKENLMEHINRIELQGRVGTIRTNVVGNAKVANFSLATDYLYKGRDGAAISETTWHNIVAWAGKDIPDLDTITKGMPLHVTGRLRTNRYTSADGTEKLFYEVLAYKIKKVEESEEEGE